MVLPQSCAVAAVRELHNDYVCKRVPSLTIAVLFAVWELHSGAALYEGMTVGQVLYAVVYDDKRPPAPDGCPPEYAALMHDCWKSEPSERCASFSHSLCCCSHLLMGCASLSPCLVALCLSCVLLSVGPPPL